jgi:hypothetical protein
LSSSIGGNVGLENRFHRGFDPRVDTRFELCECSQEASADGNRFSAGPAQPCPSS